MSGVVASCAGNHAGLSVLSCYAAAASYLPSILILAVFFAVLYFRLNIEPTRDRIAASLLVVSIVALLFASIGLIPESSWSTTVVLAIASAAILAIRRN